MTRSSYQVIAGVLWIAAVAAGCGGGDSSPTLVLTDANAPGVAGAVLIDSGLLTSQSDLPLGGLGVAKADPGRLVAALAQRSLAQVRDARRAPGDAHDAPVVTQCSVSGSTTMTTTGSTQTSGSGSVTYDHCVEVAGVETNGSISFSVSTSSSSFKISVSTNLQITKGQIAIAESGGYQLSLDSSNDSLAFDLTSNRLQLSVSVGGAVRDQLTLSNVDIHAASDLSGDGQQTLTESFDIESTRLTGRFRVETMAGVAQRDAAGHQYPYAGSLMITGANGSSLTITVAGDETFTPPTGEGQVKLELETNGTPTVIWTSWATLSAAASTSI